MRRPIRDVLAREAKTARLGGKGAGDQPHDGGLARAIAADEGGDAAGGDGDIEAAQDLHLAIAGRDRFQAQQGLAHVPSP